MSFDFTEDLIARARKYFSKKYGRDISVDEAVDFLNALADLYESFIEFAETG